MENLKFLNWASTELSHFTEPLTILGIEKDLVEDWIDEAKEMHLDMYVGKLASVVYDAIGAVETLLPYKGLMDIYIETAKIIGPPEKNNLRYVGLKSDFETNRRQFGKMFQSHIEKMFIPKVKTGSHNGIMENHVKDVEKIRKFVDKHWTRYSDKNTTVSTPKASETKWSIKKREENQEL
ncbi:hypothetical protein Ddc_19456 [Ditylenchus destructor]|nr:hypothetical protein Ddc_19456 [Ditylenchus destructor]